MHLAFTLRCRKHSAREICFLALPLLSGACNLAYQMTSHSIKLTCSFVVAVFVMWKDSFRQNRLKLLRNVRRDCVSTFPCWIQTFPRDYLRCWRVTFNRVWVTAKPDLCFPSDSFEMNCFEEFEENLFIKSVDKALKTAKADECLISHLAFKQIENSENNVRSRIKMFAPNLWLGSAPHSSKLPNPPYSAISTPNNRYLETIGKRNQRWN